MKKLLDYRFIILLTIFSLLSLLSLGTVLADPVSKPGEYSGYAEAIDGYSGWTRSSQYVAVSDGTKLAMDVFRPLVNGVVDETPYPVIFVFTPYSRASYRTIPGYGTIPMYMPVNTYPYAGGLISLVQYGYVIAAGDVRGMGASYGARQMANDRTEAWDAHDLVEWLGIQDFCDGQVAMWGASYFGQTVVGAIETVPPHLKAAYYGVTNFNFYDAWRRGGITRGSLGEVAPDPEAEVKACIPVDGDTDEDGDGYPDQLWEAVNEHLGNGPVTGLLREMPYRDSTYELYSGGLAMYYEENSPSNYLEEIKTGGVPIYVFGAWYDFLRRDTVMTFANWPNPVKMIVTEGAHGDSLTASGQFNQLIEIHRFFDYWLKGIDNGVMDEPPVYYATADTPIDIAPRGLTPHATSWQFAPQWPPHNARKVNLYLDDGSLTLKQPHSKSAKDDYLADYSIQTTVEPMFGNPLPSGAEFDQKGLTYTTNPLPMDVEVGGLPVMNLLVSSDTDNADFMVILEDVDPEGNSYYVLDGRLRASMRKVHKPPYDFLGFPWHRAYARDEHMLKPGKPVKLEMTMMPTSYVFREGHRIRLAVICSHGALFNLDPAMDENAPTWVSVYRNKIHTSFITLPIVTKSNIYQGTASIDKGDIQYEGPAELYVGDKAVFLGYGDQWIKWDDVKYKDRRFVEYYKCDGELGKLMVTVRSKFDAPVDVKAMGCGISFEGSAN